MPTLIYERAIQRDPATGELVSSTIVPRLTNRGPAPVAPEIRFWKYVYKTDTCWIWTGQKNKSGYGQFRIGSMVDGTRRQVMAHRFSYELHIGPIPDGLVLDHVVCQTPPCVRPDHLEPVTNQINLKRGVQGSKTECVHGHPFTLSNTRIRPNGRRACKKCGSLRNRGLL